MSLRELVTATDLDETARDDYEAIDEKLVATLVEDILPTINFRAVERKKQIIQITRWFLAFDDLFTVSSRRKESQKRVAAMNEISVPGVQEKVRNVYDGRYGARSAQKHFEEHLREIETRYNDACELR